MASVVYLSALSILNAQGIIAASPALIGVAELLIYGACVYMLRNHITPTTLVVMVVIFAWLSFTWLVRGEVDPKGVRDLLIPLLFISLGLMVADTDKADTALRVILAVVLAFGVFEAVLVDVYASLFNTFSFYLTTGHASEAQAMFEGQMLTLNGFRPEGIGRTILPMVLGHHRVSSLLMEPVSLGNFAVLMIAWGLSKPYAEIRKKKFFIWGPLVLIALADSRFALIMLVPLVLMRMVPARISNLASPLFPLLGVLAILFVALFMPSYGDNLFGRLSVSGESLVNLDALMWFGLSGPLPFFGDMGYAYIFSRFGLPMVLLLLLAIILLPAPDDRAMRFRANLLVYGSMILMISGTSFFALKTAGIAWFMLGVLASAPPLQVAQASKLDPYARFTNPRTGRIT